MENQVNYPESDSRPTIRISYKETGIKSLRALGYLIVIIGILFILFFSSTIALILNNEFDVFSYAIIAFIIFIVIMFFSATCFALATIAENSLIQKAIAKDQYNITQ